jgi:hypothetical protein
MRRGASLLDRSEIGSAARKSIGDRRQCHAPIDRR